MRFIAYYEPDKSLIQEERSLYHFKYYRKIAPKSYNFCAQGTQISLIPFDGKSRPIVGQFFKNVGREHIFGLDSPIPIKAYYYCPDLCVGGGHFVIYNDNSAELCSYGSGVHVLSSCVGRVVV